MRPSMLHDGRLVQQTIRGQPQFFGDNLSFFSQRSTILERCSRSQVDQRQVNTVSLNMRPQVLNKEAAKTAPTARRHPRSELVPFHSKVGAADLLSVSPSQGYCAPQTVGVPSHAALLSLLIFFNRLASRGHHIPRFAYEQHHELSKGSHFPICRLRATMAPTFSQASGYYGRRDNPSILAAGHDDFDFDLADDWNGQDRDSTSRWRKSCPDKRPLPSASRWGSRLTSLSSSVVGAGSALTKQLNVGDSTRRAIDQLRKSMIEVSTRTDASLKASLPIRHRFSEADIDRFEDEPESEKAGGEDMEEKASGEDTTLHSRVKLWIRNCR
ncbi:hypothetical protein GN244_ATG03236 [Phytophthora infestans]|uniref:Uncharacterized protein n=1 Tax=Phytophthora infestans TaxID=4787 RepID=A0A833WL19_PHYIN|nr:hypothetical protein GN244_ATG03236 [Phytophthora infestans]